MFRRFLPLVAVFCAACSGTAVRPPRAEFIIATADSAYWVSAGRDGMHVRGVPMTLARYGGRFRELYVADIDRSFDDAIFTAERLYVRDIVSNDSALAYDDSTLVRLSARYHREHPRARPLTADDDTPIEPYVSAMGEMDILDVRGPFVLIEHRSTIEQPGGSQSDTAKVAIDLRSIHLGVVKPAVLTRDTITFVTDSGAPPSLPFTWHRTGYELLVRGDTTDGSVSFMLRGTDHRLWPVLRSGSHARVYWLDTPPIDAATRQALTRAFNSAAVYDESVKYVRDVMPPRVLMHKSLAFVRSVLSPSRVPVVALHAFRHT